MKPCQPMRYGTLLADSDANTNAQRWGCSTGEGRLHHAPGVAGMGIVTSGTRNYGADDGRTTRCLSNFGFGGGKSALRSLGPMVKMKPATPARPCTFGPGAHATVLPQAMSTWRPGPIPMPPTRTGGVMVRGAMLYALTPFSRGGRRD
jgi:hypothetical protein